MRVCSGWRVGCHNAWPESFIGTLKTEMLRDGCFASPQDAAHELCAFIDGYYDTRRLHSSLNHKSSAPTPRKPVAIHDSWSFMAP